MRLSKVLINLAIVVAFCAAAIAYLVWEIDFAG